MNQYTNTTYPAISRNYLGETQLPSYPIHTRTDRIVTRDYYSM